MIEGLVYFRGPLTDWREKVDDQEILARKGFPTRWVARIWALTIYRQLDARRCGWAVLLDGEQIAGSDIRQHEVAYL